MLSIRNLQAALLMMVVVCGCSDSTSRTYINQPQPGRYALTGRVRITGNLADETNQPLGTRVVHDASGVRVRLSRPDGSSDSVLTRNGVFEFRVDDPGLYRASCWVVPPDTVSRSDVMVAAADATFPDTLALAPAGELNSYPSPFVSHHGTGMESTLNVAQRVNAMVLTLAGSTVWTYAIDHPAGLFHVHWVGVDNSDNPVPNGSYWVVVRRDGGNHFNLVFME